RVGRRGAGRARHARRDRPHVPRPRRRPGPPAGGGRVMPEQPAPDPIDATLAAVKDALGAGAPVDAVLAELKAAILRAVSLSAAAGVQGGIAVIEGTPVPPCAGDVFTGAAAMKECILTALRAHLVEQREGGVMARKTALALRARAEELEARLAAASGGREAT